MGAALMALLLATGADAQTCCACSTCNPVVCFTTLTTVSSCNDTCQSVCGLPNNTAFGGGVCGGGSFPSCVVIDPATPTPTSTRTSTPTATATQSSGGLPNGASCTDDAQCASDLCSNGFCAGNNAAPAASNRLLLLIGAALLVMGWWSIRRGVRRR